MFVMLYIRVRKEVDRETMGLKGENSMPQDLQ